MAPRERKTTLGGSSHCTVASILPLLIPRRWQIQHAGDEPGMSQQLRTRTTLTSPTPQTPPPSHNPHVSTSDLQIPPQANTARPKIRRQAHASEQWLLVEKIKAATNNYVLWEIHCWNSSATSISTLRICWTVVLVIEMVVELLIMESIGVR